MWNDYVLDKKLSVVRDQLYLKYVDWYGLSTPTERQKIVNAIGCVVKNLSYSIVSKRDYIIVSLDNNYFSEAVIYNGVDTGRRLSRVAFKTVVDWMCDSGMASLEKGYISRWTKCGDVFKAKDKEKSKVVFCDEVIDMISNCYVERVEYPTIPDVIQIRDSNKKPMEKNLGRNEKKLLKMLNEYNQSTRKFLITSEDKFFDIQLRKVYNNGSFKRGGRSYVTGEGSTILEKKVRKEIRIDGNKIVEIDFKALHPRLIAEVMQIELGSGYDPYGISLDGYDKEVLRSIAKVALLAMFNAESNKAAIGAVSKWLKDYVDEDEGGNTFHKPSKWKAEGKTPKIIEVKRIIDCLAERNAYASEWFFSGVGLELQNLDSRIMDLVMQQFLDVDEFMLPIHDSIIVEERLQKFGEDAMVAAYEQVMGSKLNCKVEIK